MTDEVKCGSQVQKVQTEGTNEPQKASKEV